MSEVARNRWSRRYLWVILAVAPLALILGWMQLSTTPHIQIVGGSLSSEDLAMILEVLETSQSVTDKHVIVLEVLLPGRVLAQMCAEGDRAPGYGQMVGLEKVEAAWRIRSIGKWDS